jgi:aminomethyltransferase
MEEMNDLRKTPFYGFYKDFGAKVVEFAGWLMPVQFSGILNEHKAVRSEIGLFDVSHMGRLEIRGADATSFIQRLTTNDVSILQPGMVQYSTICNESGGILDDVTIYRFQDSLLIVVNSSNTGKIVTWINEHLDGDVELIDKTPQMAQLAIQGPSSQMKLQELVSFDLEDMLFYQFKVGELAGRECMVSRTGYTGEDGFEIYLPVDHAGDLWQALMESGDICPCGLGARDILRLEVKYCLYGNDIDESTNPLEAGLGWLVKLDKGDFIGRKTILEIKEKGLTRKLAAFILLEKGIPRSGYPVVSEDKIVSSVASGAFSPSINKGIGTAYLPVDIAGTGERIDVEIRGRNVPAEVVKPPFYKEGSRR